MLALVSLASAYVTYIATGRAAEVAALDTAAAQQSAEEQQVEQQIDATVAQDERLSALLDQQLRILRGNQRLATDTRGVDPRRAAEYDLLAQGAAEVLRHYYPFMRTLAYLDLRGESAVYDADAATTALLTTDPRLFRVNSEVTRMVAAERRSAAHAIVLVVVMLVGALFLLTLAHVAGGRLGLGLVALALLVTAVALAWFAVIAPSDAPLLAVGLVVVLVGALVVARVTRDRVLAGGESPDAAREIARVPAAGDGPVLVSADPDLAQASPFQRAVAVVIALATLLGAGVAYLQAGASVSASDAAWEAQDLGVRAIGELRAAEEGFAVALGTYQLGLGQRVAAWNTIQRADYLDSIGDEVAATRALGEAEALQVLATATEQRSGLADELGSSGIREVEDLDRLRAQVWSSPARLAALQDAANATAGVWGGRAGVYISVLAWLAVGVYLLGLSLVFRERSVRTVLAAVGVVMLLASGIWALDVATRGQPTTREQADRAADAYAAGFVALVRHDTDEAQRQLGAAIDARGGFALAHRERAQAILEAGSTRGAGLLSTFTPEAVRRAIEDLTIARNAGLETPGVLVQLGAMEFHHALQSGDQAPMVASIAYSRRGLELAKALETTERLPHVNSAIGSANLALALLGNGETAEARAAYERTAAMIGQIPEVWHTYLVGGALATLDTLAAARPAAAVDVAAMKELVVAQVYGVPPAASAAAVTAARIETFPSIVQWRAMITGFDASRDVLITQWYRRDAQSGQEWAPLAYASGRVRLGQTDTGGVFNADTQPDTYWGNSAGSLFVSPPSCLVNGEYRLDLYLNGHLFTAPTLTVGDADWQVHQARDVGFVMCRPASWQAAAEQPGVSNGTRSPDGTRGVIVFRVHQPLAADGRPASLAALQRVVRQHAATLPQGFDLSTEQVLDPAQQPTLFGGFASAWLTYEYGAGSAKCAASNSAFAGVGPVLVTCIYGDLSWINSAEAGSILTSLIER